jgi:S1-C subfamily serine protease
LLGEHSPCKRIKVYGDVMNKRLSALTSVILALASISLGNAQIANASSTHTRADLPQIVPVRAGAVTNDAGSPPGNVLTLVSTVKNSVVTVKCPNSPGSLYGSQGSGWSAKFSGIFTPSIGFNSYIITNYHVVQDCLNSEVFLILSNGVSVSGTVFAWDDVNDLAGISTAEFIPQLNWQGSEPQQGMWTGEIGAPLGVSGTLSIGYVINVVTNHSATAGVGNSDPGRIGTPSGSATAPGANHGSSGSPVFDRDGRVFGVLTEGHLSAQTIVFRGVPLLCAKLFTCPIDVNAWDGNQVFDNNVSPNPIMLGEQVTFDPIITGTNKNMLVCGFTTPDFTDSFVQAHGITSIYYKVIDETLGTVLLEGADRLLTNEPVPVRVNTTYTPKYPNIKTIIYKTALTQTYTAQLGTQIEGHSYSCGIAVVVNHTVGEITWKENIASVSGTNYVQNSTITCQKGKLTMKVTGAKPVCAKGWIKKKTA